MTTTATIPKYPFDPRYDPSVKQRKRKPRKLPSIIVYTIRTGPNKEHD